MIRDEDAAAAFRALAQPTRLAAFRAIVAGGEAGVAPGVLAATLDVPHNTLSTHLAVLRDARLIRAMPDGRLRRHGVDRAGVHDLIESLMAACCGGAPGRCPPVGDTAVAASHPNHEGDLR